VQGLVPGSLATVFAAGVLDDSAVVGADRIPLPLSLRDVSIAVDGIPAPNLAVANSNGQEQVNFQAPFEIAGRSNVSVVITRAGESSAAVEVPVLDLQPAVYTGDSSHAVVVHNADYTLVTAARPLELGEFAFVYVAGLGRVTNQPGTGSGAPVNPLASAVADVRVTLAGITCEVQYAGLAPGFAGVYQLNFKVPANAPSGSQELIVTAGSASPPTRVLVR
jgi:minor extracellular serine protease Vpr